MATNQTHISEQEWFQSCPVGLMALDSQGIVCGVNPALEAVTGLAAEHFLGQNQETLSSAAHRPLLEEHDLVHLQGSEVDCWLQRERRELKGDGITLLYFQDVTELQQLRQKNEQLMRQMEELSITDTLTGLTNRRALTRMLDAQVTRSRRYQNPLSLALAEIIPQGSEAISDELILTVSNYLRDRLRWADVLGRWDESRFMLMLPETSEEAASTLIENISNGAADLASAGGQQTPGFRLRFGLVEWGKGLDSVRLTRRVEHALDAAEASMAS
ncbi:MAG: diguanylate cyclase [Candidatus Polarisedimenticolaceae bacterium]|nr:diguanylate cyclase [Candidatus Polarisedimenticolaceae bacterium]